MNALAGLFRLAGTLLIATLVMAPLRADAEMVDLELVLAVDVSGSIDDDEAALQRQGYISAITDPRVLAVIRSGRYGRIAMTYVEWAGDHHQQIIAGWAVIHDMASARRFTAEIAAEPIVVAHWTSISAAMGFAMKMLEMSPHRSRRRVIDISGDGANNNGEAVLSARARVLDAGITINGLPIINGRPSRYGHLPIQNLDQFYKDCVIGGTGAFIVVAHGFNDFARAIRRKMILEIAGREPRPRLIPAFIYKRKPRDCLDGEWKLQWDMEDW